MSMQKSCRCFESVPGLTWLLSWDSMWAIHKLTPEALVLQTCSLPSACKALLRHGVGEALPSLLQVGVLSVLLQNHELTQREEALMLQTCAVPSACKAPLRHGVGEALPSLLQVGVLSMLLGNHGANTVSIGTLFTRFLYDFGVVECVVRSSAAIATCQPKEQARARFLYDMGLARPCQTFSRWGC